MLTEQAKYPPKYTARILGKHAELHGNTYSNGFNSERFGVFTVFDFAVGLDMTHLLVPSPDASHSLLSQDFDIPLPRVKAYRGHRTKTDCVQESAPDAEAYVHSYISSPFPLRSFSLNRRILPHDSAALKALITALVRSINYRGDLSVTFAITNSRVTVYSPCWQNHYREKLWLRWIFYLTFLWVISWPYLWFITRRWEVETTALPCSRASEGENKQYTTKSRESFVKEWETSVTRAVLERMQGGIHEEYKLETETKAQAGPDGSGTMTGTGNALR